MAAPVEQGVVLRPSRTSLVREGRYSGNDEHSRGKATSDRGAAAGRRGCMRRLRRWSTSPTPTATSPSTSTTSPSDSEIASEAASDVVRRYFATVDLLRQDPSRPSRELTAVAASTQLAAQKKLLDGQRRDGLHQTGDTEDSSTELQSVNLDNSAPGCRQDAHGDDRRLLGRQPGRRPRQERQVRRQPGPPGHRVDPLTVANYKWSSEPTGGWRVAAARISSRRHAPPPDPAARGCGCRHQFVRLGRFSRVCRHRVPADRPSHRPVPHLDRGPGQSGRPRRTG